MIKWLTIALAAACATPASAEEWQPLDSDAIKEALTGRTLIYATAWQDFRGSGRTLYNAGADSWGYWRVENGAYCSQWPPSDLWTCYQVAQRGSEIRFIGPGGDTSTGRFKD